MSLLDEDVPLPIVFCTAFLIALFSITMTIKGCEVGHEQLGSAGHACFANRTCRASLTCYDAEGLDHPLCVGAKK